MNYFYNGDCREVMKSEELKEATRGKNVIIVSDPPFNVGYHYNTYMDKMKESEYFAWLTEVFGDYPLVCIHYPESLYKLSHYLKRFPSKVVTWVYNSNTAKQHRDIAFFDVEPNFKQVRQPYKNPEDKRVRERMKQGILGGRLYDWWNINQVKNVSKDKTIHPCQMPQEVMDRIIGILPRENLIVIDPFMGSGTTGIACMKYDVDFIGIEIDKMYFDMAKERMSAQLDIFNYLTEGAKQ